MNRFFKHLAASSALLVSMNAIAAKCDSDGRLRFLGTTNDASKSIWLSRTTAGNFRLEAAQQGQVVDSWSRERNGLRLSSSPVVSNGNGGTHKLYADSGNCLLDTQNQKDGIIFPPLARPPARPEPPIALLPDGGGTPLTPTVPTLPPSGLTPTVPTLPPTGLTPTVPTLPPSGLTPTVPTLPPSGLTPTVPTLPPTGLTPTVPTLPPTGLTPTVPTVPTLPPSGLTPTVPTLPPSGLTPTVPTLPPTGLTPTVPTLPPSGLTPTVPTQRPDGISPGATSTVAQAAQPVVAPATDCLEDDEENTGPGEKPRCRTTATGAPVGGEVPITPGRDLVEDTEYNTWIDPRYTRIRSDRSGLDNKAHAGTVAIGIDRRIEPGLVAGVQLTMESSDSSSFDGAIKLDGSGFMVGPYASYRVSENWSLYGALEFGWAEYDQRILILDGNFDQQRVLGVASALGQYEVEGSFVRPRFTLTYMHSSNDAYDLRGSLFGIPLTVDIDKSSENTGTFEATVEVSRPYRFDNGVFVMPYLEVGAIYAFERPNEGRSVTGDLIEEKTSPWSGTIRAGGRALLSKTTMADVGVAYRSLGVSDLSVWEFGLLISHAF